MNIEAVKAGFKRFVKAFIAAGLAQVIIVTGPGLSFNSLADLKTVAGVLTFAFITGGLMGIQKLFSYSPQ